MTREELIRSIQSAEPLFRGAGFRNYSNTSLLRIKHSVERGKQNKQPSTGSGSAPAANAGRN